MYICIYVYTYIHNIHTYITYIHTYIHSEHEALCCLPDVCEQQLLCLTYDYGASYENK